MSNFEPTNPAFPTYEAALEWLMSRINYEHTAAIPYHARQLKLDRMRQLLNRMGNPDAGMKIIHIAGTKGKGSTAAMIASVLTAAGYRVGVYSTPHLERIEERFAVDGEPCSREEFAHIVDSLRPIVDAMDAEAAANGADIKAAGERGPTYFDLTTAIALAHFSNQKVDFVVLEVGLGGRLDSTNVCLPLVSVITSISRDHTKQLGDTLVSIAGEKAGIVKPGVPVVSGVMQVEPRDVIASIAREHGCRLIEIDRHYPTDYEPIRGDAPLIHVEPTGDREYFTGCETRLGLLGRHQSRNAAVAIATIVELRRQGWAISTKAICDGLASVRLPGRVELFEGAHPVVVDTAHNEASAVALVATLSECFPSVSRQLIVSISRDKDVAAIAQVLAPHFERVIATEYQENPRAVCANQLAELFCGATVEVCPLPSDAWRRSRQLASQFGLTVITGSFFIAAELRPLVVNELSSDS